MRPLFPGLSYRLTSVIVGCTSDIFWLEPNEEFITELSHPNNIVVSFYIEIYFAFMTEYTTIIIISVSI